ERALLDLALDVLFAPDDGPIDPGPSPLRRLSRHELAATIGDLLGIDVDVAARLPSEGSGGEGFDNAADTLVTSPLFPERLLEGVDAAITAADLSRWTAQGDPVAAFARRAFRRPVEEGELRPYRDRPFEDAVRAMLLSPSFLFREEGTAPPRPGETVVALDDHALATRLSFLVWSAAPDEVLAARADRGGLATPAGREE